MWQDISEHSSVFNNTLGVHDDNNGIILDCLPEKDGTMKKKVMTDRQKIVMTVVDKGIIE